MNDTAKRIYDLLCECANNGHPAPTTYDIADMIDRDATTVTTHLRYLRENRFIQTIGVMRNRRVVIVATGKSTADSRIQTITVSVARKAHILDQERRATTNLEEKYSISERIQRDQEALHADRMRWLKAAQAQMPRPVRDIYGEMVA